MGATKLMTAAGGGITLDAASTATDKTITVPADNGTLVYANSSGNVGIGTTSPAHKLDVNGNANLVSTAYLSWNGSSSYSIQGVGGGSGYVRVITGGSEAMRIDSSGIVTGTAGNLMLVRGTAVASTSGTAIEFTSIPSWVKRITLVLQRVTSSGTSQWLTQIGSGSYTTSGYESVSQATYSGSGATISQTAGFVTGYHNVSTTYMSGTLRLVNISGNTWVEDHTFSYSVGGSFQGGGYISLGGTLDRIRLTTVNGTDTFTGGSINIFYE